MQNETITGSSLVHFEDLSDDSILNDPNELQHYQSESGAQSHHSNTLMYCERESFVNDEAVAASDAAKSLGAFKMKCSSGEGSLKNMSIRRKRKYVDTADGNEVEKQRHKITKVGFFSFWSL